MGLGKSLTALALIVGSATDVGPSAVGLDDARPSPTLIIAPLSTIPNWEREIRKHFKPNSVRFLVYYGPKRSQQGVSFKSCDIILTTYDVVRADFYKEGKSNSIEPGPLHTPEWHRIILDEGMSEYTFAS
jgi:SNF2 family DNA or RNA helicase